MARQENPELRAQLQRAIHKSLSSKGYGATTYQSISEDVGVSRMVVQYYYPRKMAFAQSYLEMLLESCAEVLQIEGYTQGERISTESTFKMGCLYYQYLFSNEGTRRLLLDLVRDRDVCVEMMDIHMRWAFGTIEGSNMSGDSFATEQLMVMGGFYELMYRTLKFNVAFDTPRFLAAMINAFASSGQKITEERAHELASSVDQSAVAKLAALIR